jgi:hypothetical protein
LKVEKMNTDENESFDPNAIIQAAEERGKQNDLNGAQMMFQSALLNWVDAAREGGVSDADQAREAIATLWLAYAHFNQSHNMVCMFEARESRTNEPFSHSHYYCL